jgi:AAHS family 4-hydroxybenzoate transporter-like MFS transporter
VDAGRQEAGIDPVAPSDLRNLYAEYPTNLRSAGVGAGLGIGRFGAILGPLVASALVARQWPMGALFRVAAVPALLAAAAVAALPWVLEAHARTTPARERS